MRRHWCVFVLTLCMAVAFNLENIALHKHAWQFTDNPTYPEGIWSASNAVDGDKSCNIINSSHYTLSGYGYNVWWQVDLGSTYTIERMKVYGRSDGAEGCEDGTYGQNCSEMCGNCLNNYVCDPVSGSCPFGCDKGFIGLECNEIDYLNVAIQPGCTSHAWNIRVNLTLLQQKFPNITQSDVLLGGSSCKGVKNGTLLVFQYDFTQCHTYKQKYNDLFAYNNRLVYAKFDKDNAMIIRQHIWQYEVECDLVTSGKSSSHIHHGVHHDHVITVQNNISLTFYSDAHFVNQIQGNPVEVLPGSNVYVKVFTTIADLSMKLRLHSCFTRQTGSGAATDYFLIKDGCEVDKYTHIMSQSTHETTFMFQDFEYFSDLEGFDVFCNATLCTASDFTSRCMQSCNRQSQQPIVVD